MRKTFQGTMLISALLVGSQVNAYEGDSENHFSIGVGSYAFSFTNDDDSSADIDFSGYNIAAGYAVNNYFQVRVTYFVLENDDFSAFESNGFDLMAYGGVGLSKKGFRGYGGGGFFSDKWDVFEGNETFSGVQFGGGLGYNWGPAALDFVINLRQVDKYEDYVSTSGTYVAVSGNLTVSYLF